MPDGEKQGRRHSSTVIVVSTVQAATAPTVRSSDVRFDTYRASGPGGQHRNKTDSAVRATHTPTGVVVTATESRSQHVNRQLAWERLVAAVQAEHIAQQTSTAAADKAAVFAGRREWTWCGWRDEVVSPNGSRASMRHALSGRFGRTVG